MSNASVTWSFVSVGLEHCPGCCSHDELPVHDTAANPATPTVAAICGTSIAGNKPAAHAVNPMLRTTGVPTFVRDAAHRRTSRG